MKSFLKGILYDIIHCWINNSNLLRNLCLPDNSFKNSEMSSIWFSSNACKYFNEKFSCNFLLLVILLFPLKGNILNLLFI